LLLLDDPRWNQLKSTYGTGATVAQLISRANADAPLDDWYDSLFQEILHQYTLSPVAYAAVPHLVGIAKRRPDARKHLMVLIGACYAHSSDSGGPPVPLYLQQEWQAARTAAVPIMLEVLEDPQLDEEEIRYLLHLLQRSKDSISFQLLLRPWTHTRKGRSAEVRLISLDHGSVVRLSKRSG